MISPTMNRTTSGPLADPDGSVLYAAIDLRSFTRESQTDADPDRESTGEDLNGIAGGSRSFLKLWRSLRTTLRR